MLSEALAEATAQLERGEFFEAHDTLEEQWRFLPPGDLRSAVQGLIQLCAGLHKRARGEAGGAAYLLGRGLAKLERHGAALPAGSARPFLEKVRLKP